MCAGLSKPHSIWLRMRTRNSSPSALTTRTSLTKPVALLPRLKMNGANGLRLPPLESIRSLLAETDLREGGLLGERYRIERKIGGGPDWRSLSRSRHPPARAGCRPESTCRSPVPGPRKALSGSAPNRWPGFGIRASFSRSIGAPAAPAGFW